MQKQLSELRQGDRVHRYFYQVAAMELYVVEVTETRIYCKLTTTSVLEFDRQSGEEIEPRPRLGSGRALSFIRPVNVHAALDQS
jgi:hypothetical protein